MANKVKPEDEIPQEEARTGTPETEAPETAAEESPEVDQEATPESETPDPLEDAQKALAEKEDQYLRLAAEYDNFRRRSVKEKSEAYSKAKADAAAVFLPVYDNLERALQQGCEDEAFLKGVEMTMAQLKNVLSGLGITPVGEKGESFDPNLHNAVMHVEDETLGEGVIAEVFQTGFKIEDRVIRFAMVKVAN